MGRQVFDEIKDLVTEASNTRTKDIDAKATLEIIELINTEDATIARAVASELPYIANAVDLLVDCFKQDGRLFYIGAGTSGRLGVLDASECPPTYGTDPKMVQGIIAGGYEALVQSQEGAEDIAENGATDLAARGFSKNDIACGIAASRRTPYVIGAIDYASKLGAKTLYVTCNPRSEMNILVDVAICVVVGPEVVMGSTRMKAGTATKMVLNMLTTASMIKLGKVYGNMMVDLKMNSQKLVERSKRTVMMVTGLSYEESEKILLEANGHVKTAIVMALADASVERAKTALEKSKGFVRRAIALLAPS